MSKIAIIGYGNVGFHFAKILSLAHHVSIFSRSPQNEEVNSLSSFTAENFDYIFLTLPDDVIEQVSDSFATSKAVVVHTSGSRPLSDLNKHPRSGVIYPLQTFTKNKTIDAQSLQLFIESKPESASEVESIAHDISSHVKYLPSEERGKIHLSAVFACNFSNHLFHIAEHFLADIGLEFKDMEGLVRETLEKAIELKPSQSQTGPASRGDVSTLAYHENLIQDERIKEIYQLLSKSIQNYR